MTQTSTEYISTYSQCKFCERRTWRRTRRTSFEIHDVVNMSLREETLYEQLCSWSNMVVRRPRCRKTLLFYQLNRAFSEVNTFWHFQWPLHLLWNYLSVRWNGFWRGSDTFGSLEAFCVLWFFLIFWNFWAFWTLIEVFENNFWLFWVFRIPARCTSDEWKRYLQVQAEEKPKDREYCTFI